MWLLAINCIFVSWQLWKLFQNINFSGKNLCLTLSNWSRTHRLATQPSSLRQITYLTLPYLSCYCTSAWQLDECFLSNSSSRMAINTTLNCRFPYSKKGKNKRPVGYITFNECIIFKLQIITQVSSSTHMIAVTTDSCTSLQTKSLSHSTKHTHTHTHPTVRPITLYFCRWFGSRFPPSSLCKLRGEHRHQMRWSRALAHRMVCRCHRTLKIQWTVS